MSPELEKQLIEKYPKIFVEHSLPMEQTCMCWGFEHGDGWYNIINNMCYLIQSHIDRTHDNRERALRFNRALKKALEQGDKTDLVNYYSFGNKVDHYSVKQADMAIEDGKYHKVPKACPQVVAKQVKEKFGLLRFYYSGGDDFVDGVYSMAEAISGVTCEECGAPGTLGGMGWVSVKCDKHKNGKREAE